MGLCGPRHGKAAQRGSFTSTDGARGDYGLVMNLAFVDKWNSAVALHRPTLGQVAQCLGGSLGAVFEGVADMHYAGDNLLVRVHPGARRDAPGDAAALAVGLVLSDTFFAAHALVRARQLPRLSLLSMGVPCDAHSMLDHLQALDPSHVATASEAGRWTIHFGKALSMLFMPAPAIERASPPNAELKLIEFYYSLPYESQLSPTISLEVM
jgi:hypothetical protein